MASTEISLASCGTTTGTLPSLAEMPSDSHGDSSVFAEMIAFNRKKYEEHVARSIEQGFFALTYDEFLDLSIEIWNTI